MDLLKKLEAEFPLGMEISGEQVEKDFIRLFSSILSLRNILSAFDRFEEVQPLTARDLQDYQSIYIDLYPNFGGHYRGLKEWEHEDGYLTDIVLTAQDCFKKYLEYFRIPS